MKGIVGRFFVVGSLLLVFWGIDHLISRTEFAEPLLTKDLTELQSKQIEIYLEMNRELISLATLILVGLGALVFYVQFEKNTFLTKGQLFVIGLSITMAALSVYMGYLSYDKTVWMLSQKFLNLGTPLLYWVRTLQFFFFIGSMLLFIWFWLGQIRTT